MNLSANVIHAFLCDFIILVLFVYYLVLFYVRAIFRRAQILWKISKHRKIYMKIISISFVRQMHIAVQFYEANMLIALCSESAVDLVLWRA